MKRIPLAFTEQQLGIINEALIKLPYFVVAGLIQDINAQRLAQEDRKKDLRDEVPEQGKQA